MLLKKKSIIIKKKKDFIYLFIYFLSRLKVNFILSKLQQQQQQKKNYYDVAITKLSSMQYNYNVKD